jgi:hypothetical protein
VNDDLIFARPEPKHLVKVADRELPDFCEICGSDGGGEMFWSGSYKAHLSCYKDAKAARRADAKFIPNGGMTVNQFMATLATKRRVIKRLFDK